MSAKAFFEDALTGLLLEAERNPTEIFPEGLQLGCEIIPGRTKRKYPTAYVAINGDEETPRGMDGKAWLVEATIWNVIQVDERDAATVGPARLRRLTRWLGSGCPARGYRTPEIIIVGLSLSGPVTRENADYTWADVIPVRAGVALR